MKLLYAFCITIMKRINERVVQLNVAEPNAKAKYVLYWMQMFKRTTHNHALIYAIRKANDSAF